MRVLKKLPEEFEIKSLYSLQFKKLWFAYKNEHPSFLFLCAYYLFEYIRPQQLYPIINFIPWGFVFLLLAFLAFMSDKSSKAVSYSMNKLFILFIMIVIISGLLAYSPLQSWNSKDFMLSWLVVYFLTINIINSEKRLFLFFLAYMLFNLKMGQHGVLDWAKRGFAFADYGLVGSGGFFKNSGEFALQMLIFGSLTIAFTLSLRGYWGKYKKLFLYLAASTGYLVVVGASSRGSQLGLLLIFVVFSLSSKNGIKGLLGLIVIGSLLYSILPDEQMNRFVEMGDDATSLQRLAYWAIGLDLMQQYPIFGIGYSNWLLYVSTLYPTGIPPLNIVQVPHSIYIQAGAELGYVGLFVFIIMALVAFITNIKTRNNLKYHSDPLLRNISYGLDAGLIGFLVAGAFVTVLYYPFFWIQIAMIVSLNNVSTKIIIIKNGE